MPEIKGTYGPDSKIKQDGGNGKMDKDKEKDTRPEFYQQKYSDDKMLAEAVLIGGRPAFLIAKKDKPQEISIAESISLTDKTLKPLEANAYINNAYSFYSQDELKAIIAKVQNESLDTLYRKVIEIWRKYIDADDFHIVICAADTIFTYFQDKIGMTHYLFFVGNNGSGKSNNLRVFQQLAYRNMFTSDMTPANIYQFLGSIEEGQGTLCEDEADNIDGDRDKMKIYKNGYTKGIPVLRTDASSGRKQYRFYTYCFKAFAGEKTPDPMTAKGFLQRVIELPCFSGFPKYDITEVINPAGEQEHQALLDELTDTRRILFVYRLLHFHEIIPKIKLNISGRENQLFSPLIRLFQKSDTKKDLLPVISKYISQRREKNADSFHAFLYRMVKELIDAHGDTIESDLVWKTLINTLPGEFQQNKPLSYQSADFGEISQRYIIQTLKDIFAAEKTRDRKARKLKFDKAKLERLGRIYELQMDIQVMEGNQHEEKVTLMTLMTLPGALDGKQAPARTEKLQESNSGLGKISKESDVEPTQNNI